MSYLYILEINPLLVSSLANIFSQSVGCLFTLFMVSFAVPKREVQILKCNPAKALQQRLIIKVEVDGLLHPREKRFISGAVGGL